ncbi:hypothetical protein J8I87_29810 [Paraburkholderia sp. LEh10]|uniref:hypothetical protein n=1 Tax=Paraburkholderia sp. LEh10 TaxID=2821353 RepID=UPI001AE941CC|nr:hypothetical protein [Paraburkholderia sp. LEh10]MBP0593808.1 hypothetical protein [Paraburkholderia sp. LEh10]
MTCLNERILVALFFLLSGYAYADGFVIDSREAMTVANIAPLPMELVPPIPEPQRYLQRYEMESRSNQLEPYYAQIKDFYSAPLTHDLQPGTWKTAPPRDLAPQQASNLLHLGPSTAPQLSIVQLPNTTLTLGAQPQRRLSLTVNDWVFSATARVAVLHSHDTGATFSARHRY